LFPPFHSQVHRRISFDALSAGSVDNTPEKKVESKTTETGPSKTEEVKDEDDDVQMEQAPEEGKEPEAPTAIARSSTADEPYKPAGSEEEKAVAAAAALVAFPTDSVVASTVKPPTPVMLSPRSNESFRVLTECPLIVMLLFQLYPRFLRSNISSLIKVMMEALGLRAPKIQTIERDGRSLGDSAKRLYFSRCRDLAAAQAKTLSFLTYLLRGFSNDLKPYEDRLATNVVALMSSCPRDLVSTRKELLVATRHLLNSDFRSGFFRHVDSLIDEKLLMGAYHRHSEQNLLRPLGYTVLSDFVQHVRTMLTLPQISKVVSIFSRLAHDSSLPVSSQYTSVKTLLSVVDPVYQNKERDPQIGRDIIVRILRALVEKLSAINSENFATDSSTEVAIGTSMISHSNEEAMRENKSVIRAIVVGMKTLVWYLNSYGVHREKEKIENVVNRIDANVEVFPGGSKITHTERAMIDKYITLAFPSISVFKADSPDDPSALSLEHYRDTLSFFAAAFTTLDGANLRKVWGRRLDLIVDAVRDDPAAIIMPRHLLNANPSTSFEFSSMMLNFLVPRMDRLAVSLEDSVDFISASNGNEASSEDRLNDLNISFESKQSGRKETMSERVATATAYLQLFERVLRSLSSYPENERALRPHLKQIVSTCVRNALEKSDFSNDNYCMLLRYAFRSISAGKFEDSYRELLPLIPTVLNGFFRVVSSTEDLMIRHNLMELILTIPARLSSLLPHMNLLLRVIVMALESQIEELANLGYVSLVSSGLLFSGFSFTW
jgi:transformation/transcription domain-associated protein